jgi:membrane protein implicated in regulation of membrane protease activity
MKKDALAISVSSAVLLIYCALASLPGISYLLLVLLFLVLHVLLIWMVYRILKQPTKVEDTFEE